MASPSEDSSAFFARINQLLGTDRQDAIDESTLQEIISLAKQASALGVTAVELHSATGLLVHNQEQPHLCCHQNTEGNCPLEMAKRFLSSLTGTPNATELAALDALVEGAKCCGHSDDHIAAELGVSICLVAGGETGHATSMWVV